MSFLDQSLINNVILAVCTQGQKKKKSTKQIHVLKQCVIAVLLKCSHLFPLPCVEKHQSHLDMQIPSFTESLRKPRQ